MKLCVLHCGHPKTGTSSLQAFLAANAGVLAEHGVLYPILSRADGLPAPLPWAEHNHGPALKAMAMGQGKRRRATQLDQLTHQMATSPHDVLLISTEYLFKALFYAKRHQVWEALAKAGYRIETVSYLRDQPQRLASAYAQQCKIGNDYGSFDDYCREMLKPVAPGGVPEDGGLQGALHYDALAEPGAHDWGWHHFRPFSAEVRNVGVEGDFMSTLTGILARHGLAPGLTPEVQAGFVRPERVNDRDGVVLIALCRRFARRIKDQFSGVANTADLGRAAYFSAVEALAQLGIADPRYAVLTPERVARLSAEFAATNAVFAQAVWNRPWTEVMPPPDPAGLISTDLEEVDDSVLQGQFRQALQRARPLFNAAIQARRARQWGRAG